MPEAQGKGSSRARVSLAPVREAASRRPGSENARGTPLWEEREVGISWLVWGWRVDDGQSREHTGRGDGAARVESLARAFVTELERAHEVVREAAVELLAEQVADLCG